MKEQLHGEGTQQKQEARINNKSLNIYLPIKPFDWVSIPPGYWSVVARELIILSHINSKQQ